MKSGDELNNELWQQCRERDAMEFPRKEVDGTISEDYKDHLKWIDVYYGR